MRALVFDDNLLDSGQILAALDEKGVKIAVFGSVSELLLAAESCPSDLIVFFTSGSLPATKKLISRFSERWIAVIGDKPFDSYGLTCLRSGADFYEPVSTDAGEVAERIVAAWRGLTKIRTTVQTPKETLRLIGSSEQTRQLEKTLSNVAPGEASVFIWGESGVGKELAAKVIHSRSGRSDGPLVIRSCASFNLELFEADMFGYIRGAFTGASSDSEGVFGVARNGTLVLDEISELPVILQAKLLRVLQDGTYSRVGDQRVRSSNARIITISSEDPRTLIAQGKLREDLLFRLNTLEVRIPALAERIEDVPELARFFCPADKKLTSEATEYLMSYDWPGNIRELKNAIEAASVLGGRELGKNDFRLNTSRKPVFGSLAKAVTIAEQETIKEALSRVDGNRTRAARLLGISRANLIQKIKRLHLDT